MDILPFVGLHECHRTRYTHSIAWPPLGPLGFEGVRGRKSSYCLIDLLILERLFAKRNLEAPNRNPA